MVGGLAAAAQNELGDLMMRRGLKIGMSLFALIILGPPLWLILRDFPAYAAKAGRVVDAQGKGLSNVAIIASAQYSARNPLHGGSHAVLYRYITYTDSSGNYFVPGMWSHAVTMFPVLPGATPKVDWIVTAFRLGYVIVGDEMALELDERSGSKYWPHSTSAPPKTEGWMGAVRIAPIKMIPANISITQASVYYGDIIQAQGRVDSTLFSRQEVALRKIGYDYFVPLVCIAPPDQRLDWDPLVFAYNEVLTLREIQRAEPTDWAAAYSHPELGYKTARNICSAMTGAGAYP